MLKHVESFIDTHLLSSSSLAIAHLKKLLQKVSGERFCFVFCFCFVFVFVVVVVVGWLVLFWFVLF